MILTDGLKLELELARAFSATLSADHFQRGKETAAKRARRARTRNGGGAFDGGGHGMGDHSAVLRTDEGLSSGNQLHYPPLVPPRSFTLWKHWASQ
jgi:hypothetical protein